MPINKSRIDQAMTYQEYRKLLDSLIEINQTTGTNHSPDYLNYAKMNIQRMNRLDKTVKIEPTFAEKISSLTDNYVWLAITEGWCGDAAQILPVINKMAELNPKIQLSVLLRDENLDIMDSYLTNGGRAIPKIILLEANTFKEIGNWGPRPKAAQELYWQLKNDNVPFNELSVLLHTWYAKDKTKAIQTEFSELVSQSAKSLPLEG